MMKFNSTFLLIIVSYSVSYGQFNTCDNSNFLCNKNSITINNLTLCEESHPGILDSSCVPERAQAYGKWFKWIIFDSGTLSFDITPLNPEDDIDFAVYKSDNPNCENMSIERCMASGINYSLDFTENFPCMGLTGLRSDEIDIKEDLGCLSSSNNYLKTMECSTGEVYYLLIQNITDTTGFSVSFGGSTSFVNSLEQFESMPALRDYSPLNIGTEEGFCNYSLLSKVTSEFPEQLSIYPNPTSEKLTWKISNSKKVLALSILDLNGIPIKTNLDTKNNIIDVSSFKPGTYILKVQTEKGQVHKLWVKM